MNLGQYKTQLRVSRTCRPQSTMPRKESPLWDKYCLNKQAGKSSGNYYWDCKLCGFHGSGTLTRLVAHLAGIKGEGIDKCVQVTLEAYQDAIAVAQESELTRKKLKRIKEVEAMEKQIEQEGMMDSMVDSMFQSQPSMDSICASSKKDSIDQIPIDIEDTEGSRRKSLTQSTIRRGSNAAILIKKDHANTMLVRCIVEGNLSFNLLKMSCWRNMLLAFSDIGEKYSGITYNDLRVKYLKKEHLNVQHKVENVKALWPKYGVTILSDGWIDTSKRALVNILVSCCYGTMYLKTIDCSGVSTRVDVPWLAKILSIAIKEVKPENVVQIVTDNASNCVSMGHILETKFPSLVWTPCASHCLDLLLEDIGKLSWVRGVHKRANYVVRLFTKKRNARKIFSNYSSLVLLRPSATRFGYILIVLERLARVWRALEQTVVSNYWEDWNDSKKPDAVKVKSIVQDNSTLPSIMIVISIMRLLFSTLRLTDREGSTMGLLYEFMRRARDTLQ